MVSKQALQVQEADETRRRHHRRQRVGRRPRTVERLAHGGPCVELTGHREDVSGDDGLLHPQLHLVVSDHTPRVYATVAADVNTDWSVHGPALRHGSSQGTAKGGPQPLSVGPPHCRSTTTYPGDCSRAASSPSGLLIPDDGMAVKRTGSRETEKGSQLAHGETSPLWPLTVSGHHRHTDPLLAAVDHFCDIFLGGLLFKANVFVKANL